MLPLLLSLLPLPRGALVEQNLPDLLFRRNDVLVDQLAVAVYVTIVVVLIVVQKRVLLVFRFARGRARAWGRTAVSLRPATRRRSSGGGGGCGGSSSSRRWRGGFSANFVRGRGISVVRRWRLSSHKLHAVVDVVSDADAVVVVVAPRPPAGAAAAPSAAPRPVQGGEVDVEVVEADRGARCARPQVEPHHLTADVEAADDGDHDHDEANEANDAAWNDRKKTTYKGKDMK